MRMNANGVESVKSCIEGSGSRANPDRYRLKQLVLLQGKPEASMPGAASHDVRLSIAV